MLKKLVLILLITSLKNTFSYAQTADDVYNTYIDFNEAKMNSDADKQMTLAEKILPDTAKLNSKVKISFFNSLAKLYEDDNQCKKAIIYYKKVVAASPDYYIAHRAIGYLYSKGLKGENAVVDASYITQARNALPHLEKAQACEPDDNTLALIKTLYHNLHDEQSLNALPARLKKLKKNCIDLLSDH